MNTRDIGIAISEALEGNSISTWSEDEHGDLREDPLAADVTFVDCGDPNNVKIFLTDEDGDWEFEVMIVARRTP